LGVKDRVWGLVVIVRELEAEVGVMGRIWRLGVWGLGFGVWGLL